MKKLKLQNFFNHNHLFHIPDIDEYIINKVKSIPINLKLAFFSTVIFSLLMHGYMFLNKFVNNDSIGNSILASLAWGYEEGKWFLGILEKTRGIYRIPWLFGIFIIIYLACTVMLVVSIFEIKSKLYCIMISFLMVSFPSLAYIFGFDFVSDTMIAALLLSTSAVYFTKKYKRGYILGAFSLMLSLALYQSYIGFTIGLCLILMMKHILNESNNIKNIIQYAMQYVLCGVLGIIFYLISVRLSLIYYGGSLRSYRGIDQMGRIPLDMLPSLIKKSYTTFFDFFRNTERFFYVSNALFYLYCSVFILIIYFLIKIVIINKVYKDYFKILMLAGFLLIMPVGLNIITVIAPQNNRNTDILKSADISNISEISNIPDVLDVSNITDFPDALVIYQFILAIIFVFVLCEIYISACSSSIQNKKGKNFVLLSKWVVIIVTFLIGHNYWLTTGLYYFKAHIYYERTYAFYNRVLARVEETEGFRKDIPFAIIGQTPDLLGFNESNQQISNIIDRRGYNVQFIGLNLLDSPWRRGRSTQFISEHLGVELKLATEEQVAQIIETEDFRNMPIWPEKDSVAMLDDVIVVKLNPDPIILIEQIDGRLHLIESLIPNVPEDFLYEWHIYRGDTRIDTIVFEPGRSSFEYEFKEFGNYGVIMYVRTQDNESFISEVWSGWLEYEP